MTQTFYFNTGVRPESGSPLLEGQEWHRAVGGGYTKVLPFTCEDVPQGARFAFACNNPDLHPEGTFIVRPLTSHPLYGLLSKYAYFYPPPQY